MIVETDGNKTAKTSSIKKVSMRSKNRLERERERKRLQQTEGEQSSKGEKEKQKKGMRKKVQLKERERATAHTQIKRQKESGDREISVIKSSTENEVKSCKIFLWSG